MSENNTPEKISIKQIYLKLLEWRRVLNAKKWLIVMIALAGATAGIVSSIMLPANYTAECSFVLDEGNGAGGLEKYLGLASSIGMNLGGKGADGLFQGENIIALYKSRAMLKKALLTKGIVAGKEEYPINRYIKFSHLNKKDTAQSANINFDTADPEHLTREQDSVVTIVVDQINKRNLKVSKPDKASSIIVVAVKSTDEGFSKLFNDNVVATVNEFYIQTKTKKALKNVAILQHQTDSVRAVLNGSIIAAASTMDKTANLNPARQVLRVPVQRSQLNAEATKAVLAEFIKNLELSKISLRQETPLIQVIDMPNYPLKKDKIGLIPAALFGFFFCGFLAACLVLLNVYFRKAII